MTDLMYNRPLANPSDFVLLSYQLRYLHCHVKLVFFIVTIQKKKKIRIFSFKTQLIIK